MTDRKRWFKVLEVQVAAAAAAVVVVVVVVAAVAAVAAVVVVAAAAVIAVEVSYLKALLTVFRHLAPSTAREPAVTFK